MYPQRHWNTHPEFVAPSQAHTTGGAQLPPCTQESHDIVRAEAASIYATPLTGGMTSPHGMRWWETRRPWKDAGLVIGECLCGSTLAIEVGE